MEKAAEKADRRGIGAIARAAAGAGLALALVIGASAPAAASGAPRPANSFGAYLAGLHAERARDYRAAASWFDQALQADPQSPELIGRAFLMEASEGRFKQARALADKVLKLHPGNAIAKLVLLIARVEAGDSAGALARAQALPADGIQRFVAPLALAWTRMATGDLPGADAALQELDKFNGFAPLKFFQLGLLYDFAGRPSKAEANFRQALKDSGQLNWRLTDAMANFYARHGHPDKARAIFHRFLKENPASELIGSWPVGKPGGKPKPLVASARDGLAEALFDLASVVNQPQTIDLALLYDRFALELRPQLTLAQLLLSDILSAEKKPQMSLDALAAISPRSRYYWSAQLRMAANLAELGHLDIAIALLKKMAAEMPKRAGADMQLGDLLRSKKRFAEAVTAYDKAIQRLHAAGLSISWSLYYSRGTVLERSGQWKRAEGDLLHALKLKPDQPMVLNYLGYSWVDRGENLHRALKMIEKAVELRPEDGYIVDSLGWAHYRLGEYASAVKYLQRAIELVPDDPTINDHLGDAYWQTGRPLEARYQWRRALQFGPDKDEIKPIEAKIARGLTRQRAGGG